MISIDLVKVSGLIDSSYNTIPGRIMPPQFWWI
ncbi:Protein of unknown function [Lactobacillus helveticus CIRM-BIA 103]|nr:Protein of unknown function [Lactobacillus helveticus CIRM-BIA 103]